MARCYPQDPQFTDKGGAEKAVFEALRDALPEDALLFHSVQLRDGSAEHEIDLLVLWPEVGIAAIEVKGGLVSSSEGCWYQSDAKGKHRLKQSPMAQVQSSAHALKDVLYPLMGTRVTSRMAHIVVLPYTPWPADYTSVGFPRELIIDRGQMPQIAQHVRGAIENQGGGLAGLTLDFAERMVKHLSSSTGPLGGDQAEVDYAQALGNEQVQETLTARQQILLSATRSLPRVRFIGGAGSGKTWMALAKARELSKQGLRVGLFCYNKGLGHYLKSEVGTWRQNKPVHTGEFHEYARSLGVPDGSGQEYFDVAMPAMLREIGPGLDAGLKLDAVIVDEAQDFAPDWWEALLSCTVDPTGGRVYAFMDSRQDVYRRWDGEAVGESFGPAAALVPIHVDDNLRNTRSIAQTFKGFIDQASKLRGGDGIPVRFVASSTEDSIDTASDCVDALLDEGWANNQIALLTTNKRHPVHQGHFEDGTVDSEYWPEFHRRDGEFYGHVLGFKGLERSVVILCVNGFKDMGRAAEMLYVGFSRARSLLVVVGDPDLLDEACGHELPQALSKAQLWDPHATQQLELAP